MSSYIKRKEHIILTAIEIISDLGFHGLSTKEISGREGISDGTLYKHFKNKNEIILGVLDYYSKYDDVIKETIDIKNLSSKASIIFFMEMLTECYENYPAITAITSIYETLAHEPVVANKITDIYEERIKFIVKYIERGIDNKEFSSNIDSESLTNLILGVNREIILKWRLNNYNFPLKEKVMSTIDMLFKLC
jgi:AcrR family transcriptional regulator